MPLGIDTSKLPAHLDSREAEERWGRVWEEQGIYRFEPDREGPRFAIDTPPPTVSGSLHVGHVFSYTQTDALARFQRMRGRNVFYPMGWDDNGLPTERRVQNYYHVRCEPGVPHEPELRLPHADDSARKGPPRKVSRANFIELCLELTGEDEKAFHALFRRLGLSVDWGLEYSTIDEGSRRIAQRSFLDLLRKAEVYSVEAPTLWDVDFRTAVAQAEVEDRTVRGAFHKIRFGVRGSDDSFIIATTRPELLAACVGVATHPEDPRYAGLVGREAVTPLFRVPVPIFASEAVDREKGTGILMVCTFGDATDVVWWREQRLALRQVIDRDGRMVPLEFGASENPSLDAAAANAHYAPLAGRTVKDAQRAIVGLLRESAGDARGGGEAPLQGEPEPVEHAVKFYERGDRPLEYITTRQWFARILDHKDELLAAGDEIVWHPDFMRLRFRNWTENLQIDWCISRQRFFGVPFPIWYRLDAGGRPDFERPLTPDDDALPVDPTMSPPPRYSEDQRDRPGGFRAESDIFDTWFTSSMSPQIATKRGENAEPRRLLPMDLRPQSHEIIRTWAFYTIVKSLLHEKTIPWFHAAISGWVLDPDRRKMSKSKGNVLTPIGLLDQYGADAVRYWALSAKLGVDTTFDEKVLKVGRRLVTKLFNVSKYVLGQSAADGVVSRPIDKGFLHRLGEVTGTATAAFEEHDYATALAVSERFFWSRFTDSYVELVKARARSGHDGAGRSSAVGALHRALAVFLRLFAPFLPYVTEETWSWMAKDREPGSVHRSSWPDESDFSDLGASNEEALVFDAAASCLEAIHRAKSARGATVGRHVDRLTLRVGDEVGRALESALSDVLAAARVTDHELESAVGSGIEVADLVLAQTAPAGGVPAPEA